MAPPVRYLDMPRQRRLLLPGVAAHIIQRGNNRAACFRDDGDYLLYLLHLRELSRKFDCAVHSYCLMPNHVHMLVSPSVPEGCMALMRELGQRYVQYFNRRHRRTGTLWEGRFRSCLTESPSYVLACYRYIELNPVRAGIVDAPEHYPWSSYAVNVGRRADPLVAPHPDFAAFGGPAAYEHLFRGSLDSAMLKIIREATNGGYPLGTDAFKGHIAAEHGRRIVPGRAGRPSRKIGL